MAVRITLAGERVIVNKPNNVASVVFFTLSIVVRSELVPVCVVLWGLQRYF